METLNLKLEEIFLLTDFYLILFHNFLTDNVKTLSSVTFSSSKYLLTITYNYKKGILWHYFVFCSLFPVTWMTINKICIFIIEFLVALVAQEDTIITAATNIVLFTHKYFLLTFCNKVIKQVFTLTHRF